MPKYQNKNAVLYFNDLDAQKIAELKKYLRSKVIMKHGLNYLLFYDPYKAEIDWNALAPYFFGWGEVIINHMVSDTKRAVASAKSPEAVNYIASFPFFIKTNAQIYNIIFFTKNIVASGHLKRVHGKLSATSLPIRTRTVKKFSSHFLNCRPKISSAITSAILQIISSTPSKVGRLFR